MAKRLLLLFLLAAIFPAGGAQAEVKTFSREMRRVIGENQSRDDARAAAVAEAKRQALEEAGTYLETLTVVRNFQVARDDMLALAAGVTRSRVVEEEPFLDGDAFGIRVVVAVSVDTATLDERIKKLLADRRHLADLKASQKRVAELLEQNKALQEKVRRLAAGGASRQQIQALQAEFRENTRNLTAQQWFHKGAALWNGKAFDSPQQAVQFFSKAIGLDSGHAFAYNNRGLAYDNLKQFPQAIDDFNRAIQLDPGYGYAYNNRGVAYHNLKEFRRAIEDYDRAIELDPSFALAYSNRGAAYHDLKEFRRAIENFDRAIELDPGHAFAYNNRGNAYRERKQFRRAIEDYDRAIALDPGYAPTYINRGVAYGKLEQIRRAIEDFDRAIELDPGHAFAYVGRGLAYYLLKQPQRAIEDYDRAIELDPGYARGYYNRGNAYSGLGQQDRACRDWRKACDLGETNACEWLRENKTC